MPAPPEHIERIARLLCSPCDPDEEMQDQGDIEPYPHWHRFVPRAKHIYRATLESIMEPSDGATAAALCATIDAEYKWCLGDEITPEQWLIGHKAAIRQLIKEADDDSTT